jgi:competence protein ComEA
MKLKYIKTIIFIMIFVVLAAGFIYNIKKQSAQAPEIIQFFDKDPAYGPDIENAEYLPVSAPDSENEESPGSASYDPGLVNINTAGQAELESLPGIGPVKAKAIMDYRKACKGFVAPEEIMEVRGIGKATYQKIKDLITLE